MDIILTEALDALLTDHCTAEVIREIHANGNADTLWDLVHSSGFANAMLSEANEGADLSLPQAYPLFELCGKTLLPLPLPETMLARKALTEADMPTPTGAIGFALAYHDTNTGRVITRDAPFSRTASTLLVEMEDSQRLLARDVAQQAPSSYPMDDALSWDYTTWEQAPRLPNIPSLRVLMACVTAARLAGTLLTTFDKTLQYANERKQFGRPIGKFQAIQHQLSVLAEHTFSAHMAAKIGCSSADWQPQRAHVAVAKACTSDAAAQLAAGAHAIHGAIGFTEELDLQLYTQSLHHGRHSAGSESWWYGVLGEHLQQQKNPITLDILRALNELPAS